MTATPNPARSSSPPPDAPPEAGRPCGATAITTAGLHTCQITVGPDGRHPWAHEHLLTDSDDDIRVLSWYNDKPGPRRGTTPDRRVVKDDGTASTTMTVQRCCNGCGTQVGDVIPSEMAAGMAGRPLPDVTGQCPSCSPAVAL